MIARLGLFVLVFTAALAGSTLAPGGAVAQSEAERERARAEFARGVEKFEAGDWAGALTAFQEAYRIAPHPSVRVNMANAYERLSRPLEAMFHYERFLQETGAGGNRQQRREVQRALERLRGQIGEVTFRVSPDGARITIDGAERRLAPVMEPIRMTPGNHQVEVSLDGFQTVRREFIVEGGSPATVSITLERGSGAEPQPARGGAPAPPPVAEGSEGVAQPPPHGGAPAPPTRGPAGEAGGALSVDTDDGGGLPFGTPVLIAGGVTGALVVGAVITGVLALGAEADFDDAVGRCGRGADPVACDEGRDAASRADTLALLTDIFLVGAVLGAGVTAYLLVTDETGTERARGPRVSPVAGPGGGGLVLTGSF